MDYLPAGSDTGKFDDATKKAVMSRQSTINSNLKDAGVKTQMKVDGVWGPESIKVTKLYRDLPSDNKKEQPSAVMSNTDAESEETINKRREDITKMMKSAGASEEEINNALSRIGTVKVAPNNLGPSIEVPSRKDIGGVDLTANNKEVISAPLTANKVMTPEKVVNVTAGDDDQTVFDPLSKTTMKKSELEALTAQRQSKQDQSQTQTRSIKNAEPKLDANGLPTEFKPNYYHKPLIPFLPNVPIQKVGEKFYWKDSTGQVVPWTGNVIDRSMLNPASIDGVYDDDGKELSFDKNTAPAPKAPEQKDMVNVLKPLAGGAPKVENIVRLDSVVEELLNEAGATTMPAGNDKSVWQSTKDTVGKGVDAVKNAIPQPVKDVAKVVADHPVTKFAGKALGPVTTAINAPSIPHDAADAFRLSDKGDSVGSFLKGAQAAVNTAMIPTTAAALIPSPIMPAAAIADAALGVTSLGLSGVEAARDKWFPYKGKETADVKSKSANEELNRVLTLTQYKVGK